MTKRKQPRGSGGLWITKTEAKRQADLKKRRVKYHAKKREAEAKRETTLKKRRARYKAKKREVEVKPPKPLRKPPRKVPPKKPPKPPRKPPKPPRKPPKPPRKPRKKVPPRKPIKRPPQPKGPGGRFIKYKVRVAPPQGADGKFIKWKTDHKLTRAEKQRRERLKKEDFVKAAREFLLNIKYAFPDLAPDAEVRWHPNKDGTFDIELRFRTLPPDLPGFLLDLQDAYRKFWRDDLQDWWIRIAQIWDKKDEATLREEGYTGEALDEKIEYHLPLFRGRETVTTNIVRKTNPVGPDAPMVFIAAEDISKNVGQITTHQPSQVIIRLYYSEDKPVY